MPSVMICNCVCPQLVIMYHCVCTKAVHDTSMCVCAPDGHNVQFCIYTCWPLCIVVSALAGNSVSLYVPHLVLMFYVCPT